MARFPAPTREVFLATLIAPAAAPPAEDICPICQDGFSASGEHRAATYADAGGCRHVFGESCLRQWLGMESVNSCAMCRRELFPGPKTVWEPIVMTEEEAQEVLERTVVALRGRMRMVWMMQVACREAGMQDEDDGVWEFLAPTVEHVMGLFLAAVSEVGEGRWGGRWGSQRYREVYGLMEMLLDRETPTQQDLVETEARWFREWIMRVMAPDA